MSTETIFISYSNKDENFANNLANALIKKGANVWIDSIHGKNDDDIKAAAIKSASLALIITSNNALNDESLKQEKDFARTNNVDRLLVKIEACETDGKMRWEKLPVIDLYSNKEEGMKVLFQRLKLKDNPIPNEVPIAPTSTILETDATTPIEQEQEPASNISAEIKETVVETKKAPEAASNNDLARKEGLLVSDDEIESVRSLFKKQIRESKIAIALFAGASAIIIFVIIIKFDLFGSEKAAEIATSAETAYDKLLKFFPAIGAVLPNAFSGISASKIKDKKKRIAIVDKLERTRNRYKDNLQATSEADIKALEEKLEELITI